MSHILSDCFRGAEHLAPPAPPCSDLRVGPSAAQLQCISC